MLGDEFIIPESHPINEERFKLFKQACDEEVRDIIQKVKDNTLYVSFDIFIQNFKNNIDKILIKYQELKLNEENRPIYIKIRNRDRNKSNYWLLLFFINYVYEKMKI